MLFNKIPAFGFETALCHSVKTPLELNELEKQEFIKRKNLKHNVCKVLGYCPIVSVAVGILRLLIVNSQEGKFSKYHNYRSVLEILQMNIFLILIDVITTLARSNLVTKIPAFAN